MANPKFLINMDCAWHQGTYESDQQYKAFSHYLQSDGKASFDACAVASGLSTSYVTRISSSHKWHRRLREFRACQDHVELIAPIEPVDMATEVHFMDKDPKRDNYDDPVGLSIRESRKVTENNYCDLTKYYNKIEKMVDIALSNFDPSKVTSTTELAKLVDLLTKLGAEREKQAESIYALDELSQAVREIKKTNRKR